MPIERLRPTLVDYLVVALNPALIIGLVGCLVFFLLETVYDGEYSARLQWILFFFVFGAVLISRVSQTWEIAQRAGMYGVLLGGAVFLSLQTYVDYRADSALAAWSKLLNLAFMGLIWWCAHRLTYDCTYLEEDAESGNQGLLDAAGLDGEDAGPPVEEKPSEEEKRDKGLAALYERYRRYRDEKRRKRTPGVWVVYFSLAALPLFGLGQALIPPEETGRRRYVFVLLASYVACGLGLLLTTSFLGLRRYLRQRKVTMPAKLIGIWLTGGVTFICLFLAIAVVAPRPYAEFVPWRLFGEKSSDPRDASRQAVRGESPGKDNGRPGDESKDKKDAAGNRAKDKDKGQGQEKGKKDGETKSGKGDQEKFGNEPKAESQGVQQKDLFGFLGTAMEWLVYIVAGLTVLFIVLRLQLRYLAGFLPGLRRWLDALNRLWARLFGRRGEEPEEEVKVEEPEPAAPFRVFSNPFSDGRANQMTQRDLVRYTFAALEAWAAERHLGRAEDETPIEFVRRLDEEIPALETVARDVANLFARCLYGPSGLPAGSMDLLHQLWRLMETLAEKPLSA